MLLNTKMSQPVPCTIDQDQISHNINQDQRQQTPRVIAQGQRPWVDKYRPLKLNDIAYQDDVVKMLKKIVETGSMPHLLFYGPAGTGKTSSILAIANELFGQRKVKERVIELNASDERGISVVRNKIIAMTKMTISSRDENYTCPPYKIIILDEADAMTTEAQSALRKVMEEYSKITRFCFICNYINQIICPIVSRCVKFRFKPIHHTVMSNEIKRIASKENMTISNDAINVINYASNGDMRKAITLLQNLNYLNKNIDVPDVYSVASIVPFEIIESIIPVCIGNGINIKTKRFSIAAELGDNSANKIVQLANQFIINGYPLSNILVQLVDAIYKCKELDDLMKSNICFHIANTEMRLIGGADEFIQLIDIFMCIKKATL